MTKKAPEPRTLMKVPVSLHAEIKKRAKKRDISMMDYLSSIIYPEHPETTEAALC
jgi:hypothetical protein